MVTIHEGTNAKRHASRGPHGSAAATTDWRDAKSTKSHAMPKGHGYLCSGTPLQRSDWDVAASVVPPQRGGGGGAQVGEVAGRAQERVVRAAPATPPHDAAAPTHREDAGCVRSGPRRLSVCRSLSHTLSLSLSLPPSLPPPPPLSLSLSLFLSFSLSLTLFSLSLSLSCSPLSFFLCLKVTSYRTCCVLRFAAKCWVASKFNMTPNVPQVACRR